MIRARHNRFIHFFFSRFIYYLVKRSFQSVTYTPLAFDAQRSVLLLANHFSWWDGFIYFYLNKLLFKKKFHILVLEDTVRKVWFSRYLGAFSIRKHSRNLMESLQYAGHLLNDPGNIVVLFPQGKIHSNHISEISFERGLSTIMKASDQQFQLVYAATFVDFMQYRKPSLYIYLNHCDKEVSTEISEIKKTYAEHYRLAKEQQSGLSI